MEGWVVVECIAAGGIDVCMEKRLYGRVYLELKNGLMKEQEYDGIGWLE